VRTIGRREPLRGDLGRFYDAIENPRKTRGELPILRDAELRAYLADVRARTLEVLGEVEIDADADDPLLRGGFVYEMLIAHEQQHNETMLQLLMMVDGYELPASISGTAAEPAAPGQEMIGLDGGTHSIGAPPTGFAYDNERPRHEVELAPFEIDRSPVTNEAYVRFLEETGADPPLYWERDGQGGWIGTAMGRREPLDPIDPVVHISWHEADTFARWAGKRLPTEQEWEAAARASTSNRGAVGHGTGSEGAGMQAIGDVWEWTSSDFLAYPGFEAFPYPEYSQVFFGGEHKVLRGGSWATHPDLIRPSFRNWDLPRRRQIFAGLRCARDVG
jgi:gamma-glutamyl hercynylcysteine S-oxide synthase